MYKVFFRERTLKFLTKRLPPKIKHQVFKKIENLSKDPFTRSLDVKKLSFFKNLEKAYRLRIGNLRIIYELDTKNKIITVYDIDFRRTTTY